MGGPNGPTRASLQHDWRPVEHEGLPHRALSRSERQLLRWQQNRPVEAPTGHCAAAGDVRTNMLLEAIAVPDRAFPVIYARDVERCAAFYEDLGFERHVRLPPDGEAGYIGLRRGASELAVTTVESPRQLVGIEPGTEPRFEMFVYVDDVDATIDRLRDTVRVLREPADTPWGERLAWVADPEGNPVAVAMAAGGRAGTPPAT